MEIGLRNYAKPFQFKTEGKRLYDFVGERKAKRMQQRGFHVFFLGKAIWWGPLRSHLELLQLSSVPEPSLR